VTLDKRMSAADVVAQLSDGMTIGIGGWATRRKPMALVREIARSNLKDLTIVAGYGGPDIGLLAAAGKIKKLVFAFCTLDQIALDPHFRATRQAGAYEVLELDEGMFQWGLRAASMGLPFLPSRAGVGTDIITQSAFEFKTVKSPYEDGEELVAMPAIHVDVALIHSHRSDERGNILTLSDDPLFDELLVRASGKTFVSVEKVVSTAELNMRENGRFNLVDRCYINGVVELPYGAHPTSANPDYQLDLKHIKTYCESAASPEAWAEYRDQYVNVDQETYLANVGGAEAIKALPVPIY
jgi:glutaconate CoA-transferase subunit A